MSTSAFIHTCSRHNTQSVQEHLDQAKTSYPRTGIKLERLRLGLTIYTIGTFLSKTNKEYLLRSRTSTVGEGYSESLSTFSSSLFTAFALSRYTGSAGYVRQGSGSTCQIESSPWCPARGTMNITALSFPAALRLSIEDTPPLGSIQSCSPSAWELSERERV